MQPRTARSLNGFILLTTFGAAALLFAVTYLFISGIYDRTLKDDARATSEVIARHTFASMFQVMRRGWSRDELLAYLDNTRTAFQDTAYQVDIYRSPRVEKLFGPVDQPPLDQALRAVMGSGEKRVHDLKRAGFKFAVDDFGSGFSSFQYLKRFPNDFVKIEGDFILNMLNDPRDMAMVRSMARLAQELGIRTVAEFVESEEVAQAVLAVGIDLAQGYHIGRPAEDFTRSAPIAAGEPA